MQMDIADIAVAAMVDNPASKRTGNGREEPDPDPRLGSLPNILEVFIRMI